MIEIDVLPASTDNRGADAILIRYGEFNYIGARNQQKVILIDGGYASSAQIIIDRVKGTYRTDTIDCVICTHPDSDHINGLIALIESRELKILNFCVNDPWKYAYVVNRKIRDGRTTKNSVEKRLDDNLGALDDLLCLIEKTPGCKYHEIFAGMKIFDIITVIGPTKEYYCNLIKQYPGMHEERCLPSESELVSLSYNQSGGHFYSNPVTSAKNDSSVVMLLRFEDYKVLFSGDCGVEGLSRAFAFAAQNRIDYACPDYFQIPHHGSLKNASSEIYEKVKPKKLFVSAPWKSEKHPSRLLLNYLNLYSMSDVYHVSGGGLILSYNAPSRPNTHDVTKVGVFDKIFLPKGMSQ